MFSKTRISGYTESYSGQIKLLKEKITEADAILIGAGAGLSTAAGFDYSGEVMDRSFADFREKCGIMDVYSGGFYPFPTQEEFWAWWSRHIYIFRYEAGVGEPYSELLKLVKDKDYFVITTNVDYQFQKSGFDKKRLFYTQGDYGLFQCSKPCHNKTYDNEETIREMFNRQRDMRIPTELIPKCPVCGELMTTNLRIDGTFAQDEGWYAAAEKYEFFIKRHQGMKVVLLELGVGMNTPSIIKYPFWQMTEQNENATYACINYGEAVCPDIIADRSICINSDVGRVIKDLLHDAKRGLRKE